jgi:helix-turn-helix resolvase-like protein
LVSIGSCGWSWISAGQSPSSTIAAMLGVSRATVYRVLAEKAD